VRALHGPQGILARTWPSGSMALWMMVMLLAILVAEYLS
jgi:multicomponent Na+:H+ antiporter subunit D